MFAIDAGCFGEGLRIRACPYVHQVELWMPLMASDQEAGEISDVGLDLIRIVAASL